MGGWVGGWMKRLSLPFMVVLVLLLKAKGAGTAAAKPSSSSSSTTAAVTGALARGVTFHVA